MLPRIPLRRLLAASCLLLVPSSLVGQEAAPADSIRVHDGFRVQLLRSARAAEGSWISMTFDDHGRIIVGRDDAGLGRISLDAASASHYEPLEDTLRHCRGVLYAYDSLYVCATDSKGFYRLRDTTGDDRFDELKLLKAMDYRSRYGHGTNQVVLGPDGMIYIVNGNDVSFPEGVSPDSPYRDPHNDLLVPDPHDAGEDDRVGHILRTDRDGGRWEVLAGGFRNPFDLAFNADGEMFTWDADMEWDVGLPWYRPTRLNHVVSGGEYGWRWGSGKWPAHFADSLPSTMDTGLGSPTALTFGTRSSFPQRYRQALYMADWQNGRILLAHLKPDGASYTCSYEVFLEGGPLNVCDMEFGPDGHLYFITGGRGSQSGLYRVRPVATDGLEKRGGGENNEAPDAGEQLADDEASEAAAAEARRLRRQLETYHVTRSDKAVDLAWPHLDSDDRWLRWAARVALERQSPAAWRKRALDETRPRAALAALLALARTGSSTDQADVLAALQRLPLAQLERQQLLTALRVYSLTFLRLGPPDKEAQTATAARLDALYPHASASVNRELCTLLTYLDSPHVLGKTLELLASATTQEEQIHYVHMLVRLRDGWNLEARGKVLQWMQRAQRFQGGRLLSAALKNMQADFIATMTEAERTELAGLIQQLNEAPADAEPVPSRPFVRQWQMKDLLPELEVTRTATSASLGRQALAAASCLKCHRVGDEGGQIGPDLTNVGKRFDKRMLLESILEPSKVIDPKYRNSAYLLDDGRTVAGRMVAVSAKEIVLETDPLTAATVTVSRASIEESYVAPISPMPSGLVDTLTDDEILALVDLLHGGDGQQETRSSE